MRHLLCIGVLLLSIPASADKPRACPTAVEYVGEPLHPALADKIFDSVTPGLEGEFDPALAQKLDGTAEWILKNTSTPAITAAVGIPGRGMWSTSRGLARIEPATPLSPEPLFYWGSCGKAFTAATVMKLVEEGKLRYDDPLAKWFPQFRNAQAITIDHLLTHTNGIFSFNTDPKWNTRPGYRSPEEMLKFANQRSTGLCPGERWYYSNTGYVLLGLIIEKVENQPFHQVVTRKIIEPLQLRQTQALAPRQKLPNIAFGHRAKQVDKEFEYSTPYAAGNIVASAHDMVLFWNAFLSGRIISKASVQQAFGRLYPMFGDSGQLYGRGVMLYRIPGETSQPWLGHSGGTESAKAIFIYDVDSGVFVAVALNANVPAEATAFKLLNEIKASGIKSGTPQNK